MTLTRESLLEKSVVWPPSSLHCSGKCGGPLSICQRPEPPRLPPVPSVHAKKLVGPQSRSVCSQRAKVTAAHLRQRRQMFDIHKHSCDSCCLPNFLWCRRQQKHAEILQRLIETQGIIANKGYLLETESCLCQISFSSLAFWWRK